MGDTKEDLILWEYQVAERIDGRVGDGGLGVFRQNMLWPAEHKAIILYGTTESCKTSLQTLDDTPPLTGGK